MKKERLFGAGKSELNKEKYEVDSSQNNEEETNLSQGTYRGVRGRGGRAYTDKKENKIFLIYKEIQMG
jgi:hypothetical protein